MPQTPVYQQQWNRLGAIARLQQIEQEKAEIFASYPELRRGRPLVASVDVPRPPRQVRRISAAGRKAMKAGMLKYWAKRKAAEKK